MLLSSLLYNVPVVCALSGTSFYAAIGSDVSTSVDNSSYVDAPSWGRPSQTASNATCRCFPGDACWPSPDTWQAFNDTIGGRLIAVAPLASSCHDDPFEAYDAAKCAVLKNDWSTPELHAESPSSIMAPYFTNNSCNPFLPENAPCVLGSYVSYTVNVSEPMDVARTIWFATYFNIRIVIKNTGHDYNGKSTGAGAIGLWTHHLKDVKVIDYQSTNYTGKAIKAGAGVQVEAAYATASGNGLAIVGAEVPTVGYAGGYTQGGGHSALSSKYGLAADQVLEWEVVDGQGRLLTATPSTNADLYWALCGGGGGTFAVVLSMVSKAYPDIPVTGASVEFTNAGVTQEQFYGALDAFHASLPDIVDAGAMTISFFTNATFALSPLTAPGMSPKQVDQLLLPLTRQLKTYNMSYNYNLTQFSGYYEEFSALSTPPPVGVGLYGGRLIPRSVVEESNADLTAAFRYINEKGGTVATIGVNVSLAVTGNVWNAVNPAWRDTLVSVVVQTPYNQTASIAEMKLAQDQITDVLLPPLERLTPSGGAYLNEGDFQQSNWQQVFYGGNYDELKAIKDRHDPYHLFYASTGVGSEYWGLQADGRLCKV